MPASPPSGPEARRDAAENSVRSLLAAAAEAGPDGFDVTDLSELTALWPLTEPGSLPRLVRILVDLTVWCRRQPGEASTVLVAGRGAPAVADVVAGLPAALDPESVVAVTERLLRCALAADLGDGLLRGAGVLRIASAGRRALAPPGSAGEPQRQRADGDLVLALECEAGATAHRKGLLV